MIAMSPSKAARKGLMCMDMNVGAGIQSSTPVQIAPSFSDISDLASIMGSPISGNKPKTCRPKVILWKEPIDDENDELLNSSGSQELRMTSTPTIAQETAITSSPVKKSFNPKKKWLREAWQEDLGAKPLEGYGVNHPLYSNQSHNDMNNWQMASSSNDSVSLSSDTNPNQNRPSVLIMGPSIKEKSSF